MGKWCDAGNKVKDLRNWLTIYGYWNQSGLDNVVAMLLFLVDQYSQPLGIGLAPPQETPDTGLVAPCSPWCRTDTFLPSFPLSGNQSNHNTCSSTLSMQACYRQQATRATHSHSKHALRAHGKSCKPVLLPCRVFASGLQRLFSISKVLPGVVQAVGAAGVQHSSPHGGSAALPQACHHETAVHRRFDQNHGGPRVAPRAHLHQWRGSPHSCAFSFHPQFAILARFKNSSGV